jgi:hypothetical protein
MAIDADGLRQSQTELSRKSNQVARARIRRFESDMPRHAVGLTGASQVAACTLAAGDTPRPGRSKDWLKFKNPDAPAVKHEAEEEWGHERRR